MITVCLGGCVSVHQGAVPFNRVSGNGKYKVGNKVVYIREVGLGGACAHVNAISDPALVFVIQIRNTLLVRVGGGWRALESFVKKQTEVRKEIQSTEQNKRSSLPEK